MASYPIPAHNAAGGQYPPHTAACGESLDASPIAAPKKSKQPSTKPTCDSASASHHQEEFTEPARNIQSNDDEWSDVVKEIVIEVFDGDKDEQNAFRDAPKIPPITKSSLSELDIGSIINNSKLRHDVNFDRELHFRPNMDGERGLKKRSAQLRYWQSISIELRLIYHVLGMEASDAFKTEVIPRCASRLRTMFETLKDILRNLVPERDHDDVDEHIDVKLIMQKISHGVCDFVSIAQWMAQLLKRHCAPMRDDLVDRMVEKVAREAPDAVSAGLADLFTVLEAMKLDVANHQIRHLRALLIEDSINFERKYHWSRIRKEKYDCKKARKWFTATRDGLSHPPKAISWPNSDVEAFTSGFLDGLLPTTERLPDTFILDEERIKQLKEEIDDLLHENICCDMLREILYQRGSHLSIELENEFRNRLQDIAGAQRPSRWHARAADDIACEIVRFALGATGSSDITHEGLQTTAEQLATRLFATTRARAMDIMEAQYIDDHDRLLKFSAQMRLRLLPKILRTVEQYLTHSPYDIFLALVPPPTPPPMCAIQPTPVQNPDRELDLVRRIAHIAILHWRTWEHLVYNNQEFDVDSR